MKHIKLILIYSFCLSVVAACTDEKRGQLIEEVPNETTIIINELNQSEIEKGTEVIAIVGATLINGLGESPIENSLVIVKGDVIDFVGVVDEIEIPAEAKLIDAQGMTLMPGLIDAHYHNGYNTERPSIFLKKGVTSVRDPGAWMDYYQPVRDTGKEIPRLFLTGAHLDTYPPSHPNNSFLISDAYEGKLAVNRFADQGATAVKVYFGLSIGMIKAVCEAAHLRGLPVTAHLETVNAGDAVLAGLDGVEHVTSFGTALLPMRATEKYKQLLAGDTEARERGRYEVWNSLDLNANQKVEGLINILKEQGTFVSPTLAVFEKQSDIGDSVEVNGFLNMVKFVGQANDRGVKIVVGSHSIVPYAKLGNAYYREMELLSDAGLTSMQIIVAATMENARFLRIDERLGSIEKGKLADLILLKENPLEDIKKISTVNMVMLNGRFIER